MSEKKVFKFNFVATVKTVSLALKFPCVVSVLWKRGQKTAQVKQRRQIQGGVVTFNQKLEIECNMVYDSGKKLFEQKKTKFNILIFSEKGNKQAGQVYLDVAELLNSQSKQMHFQKGLDKCPDKNAKLIFDLAGYMKSQIDFDQVSKASTRTYNMDSIVNEPKPDFKKKKNCETPSQNISEPKSTSTKLLKPEDVPSKQAKSDRSVGSTNLSRENVNIDKIQLLKVQEEHQKLKDELRELKQLQVQNQNLKRQYEDSESKSVSYYKKKFDQMKKQYNETKAKADSFKSSLKKKAELQKQMCDCKQKMGRILNFALMSGNSTLAQEFYNIYQMKNVPSR